MNTDKKFELNVPESCPKCGNGAFYRLSDECPWRCYLCDTPPIVRQQHHLRKKESKLKTANKKRNQQNANKCQNVGYC